MLRVGLEHIKEAQVSMVYHLPRKAKQDSHHVGGSWTPLYNLFLRRMSSP